MLALALAAAACSGGAGGGAGPTTGPVDSTLTGLPGPVGKVLVVKIDNVAAARPQRGLDAADVVYVEPVEGGLTRLAAVFSSRLPDVVGPVRSARESDVELLRQFGTPAFAYSGAAPPLLPVIEGARLVPVSPAQAREAYVAAPERRPPHSTFARPAALLDHAGNAGQPPDIGFRFGDPPPGGTPAARHTVDYQAARFAFDWSASDGRWLVTLDGEPLAGDSGTVGAPTVVVQSVVVRPSQFADVLGSVSPYVQTVGSGPALVLRDGASHDCRWQRPSADAGTSYTTPDGTPGGQVCQFARGPVWVLLVPA